MRAFLAVAALLLLAGCIEDGPVPTPPAQPEPACEARGLFGDSCDAFCEMNAPVCGLPAPPAAPYPTALPVTPPAGIPALNGTVPTLPEGCALLPEGCPQL